METQNTIIEIEEMSLSADAARLAPPPAPSHGLEINVDATAPSTGKGTGRIRITNNFGQEVVNVRASVHSPNKQMSQGKVVFSSGSSIPHGRTIEGRFEIETNNTVPGNQDIQVKVSYGFASAIPYDVPAVVRVGPET